MDANTLCHCGHTAKQHEGTAELTDGWLIPQILGCEICECPRFRDLAYDQEVA